MQEKRSQKEIVGKNIGTYIESVGRKPKWVMEKANISKSTYYKLLKGEGDIEKSIEKINNLFGIDDIFYFYNESFIPPNVLVNQQKRDDFKKFAAANYVATEDELEDFQDTVNKLEDFINMIELLKPYDNYNKLILM